jgi:hypothetical protein
MGTRNLVTKALAFKKLCVEQAVGLGPEFPYLLRQYSAAQIRQWLIKEAQEYGILTVRPQGIGAKQSDLDCRHDRLFNAHNGLSWQTRQTDSGDYVCKWSGERLLTYLALEKYHIFQICRDLPPKCDRCSRVLDYTSKRLVRNEGTMVCTDCVSMMRHLANYKVSKAEADAALWKELKSAIAERQKDEASAKRSNLNRVNSPDASGRLAKTAVGRIAERRRTGASIRHQANHRHDEAGSRRHADAR